MSPYETKKRTGSMLCYPFEERRLQGTSRMSWNTWPVLTQPKLDGERMREQNGLLLSSTEELIYSVPHIQEALKEIDFPFEPDGELYKHGMDFDTVHSIVSRTVNQHPDYAQMQYHVFDIATDDLRYTQGMRLRDLREFFYYYVPNDSPIKLVPFQLANSLAEVYAHYEQYVANGYEGIIIRHLFGSYVRRRSTLVMKFKPKKRDDYEVIGFVEEHDKNGNPKNRLGSFICVGATGDRFNVYSGMDDSIRESLWANRANLIGKTITVHYQSLTNKHVPRFGTVKTTELRTVWNIT